MSFKTNFSINFKQLLTKNYDIQYIFIKFESKTQLFKNSRKFSQNNFNPVNSAFETSETGFSSVRISKKSIRNTSSSVKILISAPFFSHSQWVIDNFTGGFLIFRQKSIFLTGNMTENTPICSPNSKNGCGLNISILSNFRVENFNFSLIFQIFSPLSSYIWCPDSFLILISILDILAAQRHNSFQDYTSLISV